MNLILDQGNTATKIILADRGHDVHTASYPHLPPDELAALIHRYRPDRAILCTVATPDPAWFEHLHRLPHFLHLDDIHAVRLPITLGYRTPATLGRDRIAAVVGAHTLCPGHPLLVIDAGTAITYDLLLPPAHHLGGNISPGLTTRFRALHDYTRRLPLVHEHPHVPPIGTTTQEAILSGVVQGIVYEMNGYIDDIRSKHPDATVFLTGGHAFYFEGRLKCHTFATENLVWIGLNRILEYNADDK